MEPSSASQLSLQNSSTSLNVPNYVDNGYASHPGARSAGFEVNRAVEVNEAHPTEFRSRFNDCMEMLAAPETVAKYLDAHQEWFRRCAAPMEAVPIGETGYALTLGNFGALGYDIEPKIGLDLLPQDAGVYRIRTIEVPGYAPVGYEVDFQAALELTPAPVAVLNAEAMTHVEWVLDLGVKLQFPRFIRALPQALIQGTGDRLLRQIVRQISRRLTHKVQEDFHKNLGLPMPPKK